MNHSMQTFPGIQIHEQVPLSEVTTFRLGGSCRRLISCSTPEAVRRAVPELAKGSEPFVLIGGGSNILVSDEGFEGTVIRYVSRTPNVERDGHCLNVDAGSSLDAFSGYAAENALEGLSFCTGIPGTVGGAIVGNAGAWGRQVADVLERATLMDREGRTRDVRRDDLSFAYRRSCLQESGDIVVAARFRLAPGNRDRLLEEREEILAKRAAKHPDLTVAPCIGSFFRNLEPSVVGSRRQAAGWFLEQVGAKQMSVGGACVFLKHANMIIKGDEGCTAQDVFDLSRRMQRAVREQHGIALVREIRLLGRFAGEAGMPGRFH